MTTPFDRPLNGYRFVQTQHGDTLPKIAARELGDAGRWAELIVLNGMSYPYLTDDSAKVAPGVLLTGGLITVPAATPGAATNNPDAVFGQDILLTTGGFSFQDGDFAVVSGLDNLNQALTNALDTDQGELIYHTSYGSLVRLVVGGKNDQTDILLAADYAKSTVMADPRISSVASSTGTALGNAVSVAVDAVTIEGSTSSTGTTY
jgi:phage baseplate assembly protein W